MIPEEDIEILKNGTNEEIKNVIEKFNEKNANLFNFQEFNINGQWKVIWDSVFNILRDAKKIDIYPQCLSCVRILARDENNIRSHNIQRDFETVLKISDLSGDFSRQSPLTQQRAPSSSSSSSSINSSEKYEKTIIEALKCLCNMVYLSSDCQKLCLKNTSTDGIIRRVRSEQTFTFDIEYFDMKLLFLITALEPGARNKVRDDLNGLTYLTEWLDLKIKENCSNKNNCIDDDNNGYSSKKIDLICEILKVLFNITVNVDKTSSDENEILYRRLTAVVRNLLIDYGDMINEKQINLITCSVHLLTNIPIVCLSELITSSTALKNSGNVPDSNKIFEGKNVKAIEILLEYLKKVLDNKEKTALNNEQIPPILTVLVKCARCNSTLRHYIRSVILPPLKDATKRPEVGNELRNHLCRFLTLPHMSIRDLAADLLFVLCKENIGRMIKYTGYGNAAGLFANRGMLDLRRRNNISEEYSSESEDSDTDEYKQIQHNINPIIGCYEATRSNPMEGMSEEQKEYEAMQLVNLMDKLQKQGIVQPCRIDEDGKPKPVDHILELQEEIPKQQFENKNKT